MPFVTIYRRKEWIFWNRKVEVYIDGESIGRLEQGATKKIELPAGEHKLKLKMRWFQRREHKFNLFNKEEKSLVIQTNYKELLTYAFIMVISEWMINSLTKKRVQSFKFLMVFILVTCVFLIFFSRSRFVTIKEEALISY